MRNALIRPALAYTALALLLTACVGPNARTFSAPSLGYKTLTQRELAGLPEPKDKIIVAVYNFRDQTGQYKFQENVSSFSTAVTQGATAMLIDALRDSGWFVPVERESFNNLITERKIIRANIGKDTELPELLHAPLMLDGGIVAYETNLTSAGLGAEYHGIGGSSQYRKDQVTLYLRASDVLSGAIVQSVSTSKSILSAEVKVGVFRYVEIDRLLEIEAGLSTNEPPQMCVMEAVQKAVVSLIIEGILDGLWDLKDPADMNSPVIKAYLSEKNGDVNRERSTYLLQRSRSALERKEWNRAIESSNEGLGLDPYNDALYAARSEAYAQTDRLDRAMKDAEWAITLNQNNGLAYNNRGYVYERNGDYRLALLDYRKSCSLGYDVGCANSKRLEATKPELVR
ncbi:CsgG/HfaB family protein [Desulfocurvibacter africanus]|uniref:CsgG/HfaB family protein n=1 Tax=Desulfocurvibacter africanus TaxID=873 RepID=UPI002FDB8956